MLQPTRRPILRRTAACTERRFAVSESSSHHAVLRCGDAHRRAIVAPHTDAIESCAVSAMGSRSQYTSRRRATPLLCCAERCGRRAPRPVARGLRPQDEFRDGDR